jgi:hypothetical protein
MPALRQAHEDLVAETLKDLTDFIRSSGNAPRAWRAVGAPSPEEAGHLKRLAHTILNRRIADLLRKRHRLGLAMPRGDDDLEAAEDSILRKTLFGLCMSLIDNLTAEERDLLRRAVAGRGGGDPMDSRSRQQLRRLRERLAGEVKHRLGYTVKELLGR